MLTLRKAPRRWPFALRASVCMGALVLAGWAMGDVADGLAMTLGAFTVLYGSDRPYLNRAILLAMTACGLAGSVWLGASAAGFATPWPALLIVAGIAALSSLVCNALQFGPPGAYMFVLVCAAGTFIGGQNVPPARLALLTLAGGVFAWAVSLSGVVVSPRGPEKAAVRTAGLRVAEFAAAVGGAREDLSRHSAAAALHSAWTALVTYQPAQARPTGTLQRLRALNRELHLLFAEAMGAAARHEACSEALADRARALSAEAQNPLPADALEDGQIPLGRLSAFEAIREAITPGSPHLSAAIRVGLATFAAGAVASTLGLERAYWAMAAAALMLHQGLDWVRTLQRGLERTLGTWAGLALASLLLTLHLAGPALAPTLMALQFLIEMFVVRNYAAAVTFITSAALLIATGGQAVADVPRLVLARGVDTALGCVIALGVLMATAPRSKVTRVSRALVDTLNATRTVLDFLGLGAVTTEPAKIARRNLQHHTLLALQAYEESVGASLRARDVAESYWPAVVAAQRLAFRVLAACWEVESSGAAPPCDPAEAKRLSAVIGALADAIREGTTPQAADPSPAFLRPEIEALRQSLAGVRR